MSDKPDERGIDAAIAAFVATRVCGGSTDEATKGAKAILELFGFEARAHTQGG